VRCWKRRTCACTSILDRISYRFNERFRWEGPRGGVLVSDDELAAALTECETANAPRPSPYSRSRPRRRSFCRAQSPDVLLLEVGLGGRARCDQCVERPLASVITPISFDHAEFLGDTVTTHCG